MISLTDNYLEKVFTITTLYDHKFANNCLEEDFTIIALVDYNF